MSGIRVLSLLVGRRGMEVEMGAREWGGRDWVVWGLLMFGLGHRVGCLVGDYRMHWSLHWS
jgi:hypothetical protein